MGKQHQKEKLDKERDRRYKEVSEERDRRYSEVFLEREKAQKIKETADLAALKLAREIQTYKDEKANDLRSQIERERGEYVTRSDQASMVDKFESLILSANDKSDNRSAQYDARITALVGSISQIASRIDTSEGKSKGLTQGWQILIGFAGLFLTLLTIAGVLVTLVR